MPTGPLPQLTLHLGSRRSEVGPWEVVWLPWSDFRLPSERQQARQRLIEAYQRCVAERVEIACPGGHGRTGTALACLAVLDGVPAHEAVAFVRRHYDRWAVNPPHQRRYVSSFLTPWSSRLESDG